MEEGDPEAAAATLESLFQNTSPVKDADTAFAVSYLLRFLAQECPPAAAAHASAIPKYVCAFDAPTTVNALEALSWLSYTKPEAVIETLVPTLEGLRNRDQFEAGHLPTFLLRGTELRPPGQSRSKARVVLALSETAPKALAPVADEVVSFVGLVGAPEQDEFATAMGNLLAAVAAVPAEARSESAASKSRRILELGEATGQREAAVEVAGTLQTANLPGLSSDFERLVETTTRASDPAVAARGLRHIMAIGANEPHGFQRSTGDRRKVVELLGELLWRFDYAEPVVAALLCNYDSQPEVKEGIVDVLVASVLEGDRPRDLGPHRHRAVESTLAVVLDGRGPSAATGVGMDLLGRLGSTVPEAE